MSADILENELFVMKGLASEFNELKLLYPKLAQLSAIALTIPVSILNCNCDFSAMNRVTLNVAFTNSNQVFFDSDIIISKWNAPNDDLIYFNLISFGVAENTVFTVHCQILLTLLLIFLNVFNE